MISFFHVSKWPPWLLSSKWLGTGRIFKKKLKDNKRSAAAGSPGFPPLPEILLRRKGVQLTDNGPVDLSGGEAFFLPNRWAPCCPSCCAVIPRQIRLWTVHLPPAPLSMSLFLSPSPCAPGLCSICRHGNLAMLLTMLLRLLHTKWVF